MRIWSVMDECIRTGVSTLETILPGRLQLRRKAPMLYKRLMRGCVCPMLIQQLSSLFDVYLLIHTAYILVLLHRTALPSHRGRSPLV
jgi:hypothetical protein